MTMNTAKTTVLIADDHNIVRTGLKALLEMESDLSVVGEATDGKQAVAETLRLKPDVVVMDISMPVMDGIEATERIICNAPDTRVLALTSFSSDEDVARIISAGAIGIVMKDSDNDDIVASIRKTAAGETVLSPELKRISQTAIETPKLTPRQKEILHSVTRGLSNQDIAKQFGISVDGVKNHLRAIFLKLGAATRAEAGAIALRKHLLKL